MSLTSSHSYTIVDYLLPAVGALVVHAFVFWVFAGGFDVLRLHKPVKPEVHKVVQASLVVVEKKQPVKRIKPKPVKPAKPRPALKPAPKPKAEPKPVVKPIDKPIEKPIEKEQAKPRERTEDLLNELLAEEDQQLQQDQELTEVARYSAAMTQLIEQYWSRPPSARNGMQVVLVIELVPSGDVVSVNIKQGSGNAAFDRAAVLAVEKIARFDALQSMPSPLFNRYFRKIDLTFRPEDLRL